MQRPVIIVNFKTYDQATGENALKLAKICEKVANDTNSDVRVAVQTADIHNIASQVSIPVYAQHVDPILAGKNSGWILPEACQHAGASGSLVNHSEHQVGLEKAEKIIGRLRELGMKSVVCADDMDNADKLAALKPDFVAVEPPELIGGDISVSTAQPELISESVLRVTHEYGVPLLVGAGIKTGQDVAKALELGAVGVLLASGITLAENPEAALRGLLEF
ncbi:triose-phosphate isomerase [Nanoarchaeota archaeon]